MIFTGNIFLPTADALPGIARGVGKNMPGAQTPEGLIDFVSALLAQTTETLDVQTLPEGFVTGENIPTAPAGSPRTAFSEQTLPVSLPHDFLEGLQKILQEKLPDGKDIPRDILAKKIQEYIDKNAPIPAASPAMTQLIRLPSLSRDLSATVATTLQKEEETAAPATTIFLTPLETTEEAALRDIEQARNRIITGKKKEREEDAAEQVENQEKQDDITTENIKDAQQDVTANDPAAQTPDPSTPETTDAGQPAAAAASFTAELSYRNPAPGSEEKPVSTAAVSGPALPSSGKTQEEKETVVTASKNKTSAEETENTAPVAGAKEKLVQSAEKPAPQIAQKSENTDKNTQPDTATVPDTQANLAADLDTTYFLNSAKDPILFPGAQDNSRHLTSGKGTPTAALPAGTMQTIAVQITSNAHKRVESMTLHLHPADLGQVDIKLKFSKDGDVKAHLTSDKPETLAALQSDPAQLHRALQQAGFKTDESTLSFDLRQQGNDMAGQTQDQGRNNDGHQKYASRMAANDTSTVAIAAAYSSGYITNSGVNIVV